MRVPGSSVACPGRIYSPMHTLVVEVLGRGLPDIENGVVVAVVNDQNTACALCVDAVTNPLPFLSCG